jgi:hypothetical protein
MTTEINIINCPLTCRYVLCWEKTCEGCEIKRDWERLENLEDYWRHLNSDAEYWIGYED